MKKSNSNSTVVNEIINDLYFDTDKLSVERVSSHIKDLDDEVICSSIEPTIAYSLIYDLCEWLAMEMQENGILSRCEQ